MPAAGPSGPKSAAPPTPVPLTPPPLPPHQNDERKLFVGNLAWAVDGLDLEDIFKEFGAVESAQVRQLLFQTAVAPAVLTRCPVLGPGGD